MIIKYELDREESNKLYAIYRDVVKMKECYNNIFNIVSGHYAEYRSRIISGDWKVAYGYINVLPDSPLYTRHCFFVTKEGYAVDPTIVMLEDSEMDFKHMSFWVLDNADDYLEAITDNDLTPDLMRLTRKQEQRIIQELMEQGLIIIG